jgi:hypothetical protein
LHSTEEATAEVKQSPVVGNYLRNKEISTKEARRIQEMIKKGLPAFNKIPCEKLDLMEYLDEEGNLKKIVCYGHVDLEQFKNNCANQFFARIKKAFHGFHREEKRHSTVTGEYRVMVQCASNQGGAPITIGIP